MFRIKDEQGFIAAHSRNAEIVKFINGRNFEFDNSRPQHIKLDGKEYFISDTMLWFSLQEFEKYCEEVLDEDVVVTWLYEKAGFPSREEALQEFNKPKLLQIKQLEEQIEKLKSQLAR